MAIHCACGQVELPSQVPPTTGSNIQHVMPPLAAWPKHTFLKCDGWVIVRNP